jgi:hypothetical protein
MSAISRRPPSDGGSGEAPVAVGYLLDERLSDDDAAEIASRLDEALRARGSARRRLRYAAAIAVTAAAAAVVVGLLVGRSPVTVAPEPSETPPVLDQAASTAPASTVPSPREAEPRGTHPAPAAPYRPIAERPLAAEREPRQASAPPAAVSGPENPAPAAAAAPGGALPAAVVPTGVPERVARMLVQRTDDPRRPPIFMTIRYRRPEQGASKEVPR